METSETSHTDCQNDCAKPRKRLNSHVQEFTPAPSEPVVSTQSPAPTVQPSASTSVQVLTNIIKDLNIHHSFKNVFPRLESYDKLPEIRAAFESLRHVNDDSKDLGLENCDFVITKSSNFDDLHKAMKYGAWSFEGAHNEKMSEIFKKSKAAGRKLILFFRIEAEPVLCGAAEVTADQQENAPFGLWWDPLKSTKVFHIQWLFVKNVDLGGLQKLDENQTEISQLPDCTQLIRANGLFLMSLFRFKDFSISNSLFQGFQILDQREDYLRANRTTVDVKIKLQKREKKPSTQEESRRKKSDADALLQPKAQKEVSSGPVRKGSTAEPSEGLNRNAKKRTSVFHPKKKQEFEYVVKEAPVDK